jgi:hypothetical protein
MLAFMNSMLISNLGFSTTFRILRPLLEQENLIAGWARKFSVVKRGEYIDLAVFDSTQLTVLLASLQQFFYFLGNIGFINIQSAVILAAKQMVLLCCDFHMNRLYLPDTVGDKTLQSLFAGTRNYLFHSLQIALVDLNLAIEIK